MDKIFLWLGRGHDSKLEIFKDKRRFCHKAKVKVKNFLVEVSYSQKLSCSKISYSKKFRVTAAISVTRFGEKVLAQSANSIAVSKGTLDDGIKSNSNAKKSDRSCRNGVDTATGFLE